MIFGACRACVAKDEEIARLERQVAALMARPEPVATVAPSLEEIGAALRRELRKDRERPLSQAELLVLNKNLAGSDAELPSL